MPDNATRGIDNENIAMLMASRLRRPHLSASQGQKYRPIIPSIHAVEAPAQPIRGRDVPMRRGDLGVIRGRAERGRRVPVLLLERSHAEGRFARHGRASGYLCR